MQALSSPIGQPDSCVDFVALRYIISVVKFLNWLAVAGNFCGERLSLWSILVKYACHRVFFSDALHQLMLALVAVWRTAGGLLGDRLDRTHIIAFGCFLWGVMTMAIGLSTTLTQAWSNSNHLAYFTHCCTHAYSCLSPLLSHCRYGIYSFAPEADQFHFSIA